MGKNTSKLHLATDHAGYEMKEAVMQWLLNQDYEVVDHGAFELDEKDDYPDFVKKAAVAVSENPDTEKALIFGGSGQGEDMVADKFDNVRSAVYYGGPLEVVRLSREHNNANILSLGARFLSIEEAQQAIKLWLETDFSGDERHVRRINKMND